MILLIQINSKWGKNVLFKEPDQSSGAKPLFDIKSSKTLLRAS